MKSEFMFFLHVVVGGGGGVTPGTCNDVPSAEVAYVCVCVCWCVSVYVWVSLWFEVQG